MGCLKTDRPTYAMHAGLHRWVGVAVCCSAPPTAVLPDSGTRLRDSWSGSWPHALAPSHCLIGGLVQKGICLPLWND